MREHPEITICVHGLVGIGKSAVALAILDALRACGVECQWPDESSERNLGTGADDIAALSPKPRVRLIETNPTMGSLADAAKRIIDDAPPATPAGTCVFVWKHHLDRLRDALAAPPPSPSYDALLLIVQSVSGALERAGVTECDDPGEAIDVLRERWEKTAHKPAGAVPAGWREFLERIAAFRDASYRGLELSAMAKELLEALPQQPAAEPFGYIDSQGLSHAGNSTNFRMLLDAHRSGNPSWRDLQLVYLAPPPAAATPQMTTQGEASQVPRDSVPEGFAMVPRELTAENGAKAEFMGETFGGDAVSWTAVKAVHRAVVKWAEGARHG